MARRPPGPARARSLRFFTVNEIAGAKMASDLWLWTPRGFEPPDLLAAGQIGLNAALTCGYARQSGTEAPKISAEEAYTPELRLRRSSIARYASARTPAWADACHLRTPRLDASGLRPRRRDRDVLGEPPDPDLGELLIDCEGLVA